MKKKLLVTVTLLTLILLSVSVYAGTHSLLRKDFTSRLPQKAQEALSKHNITSPEHSELECDDNYCYFSMWQIRTKEITVNELDQDDQPIQVTKTINETYHLGKNHKIPVKECTAFDNENECTSYHDNTDEELDTLMQDKIDEMLEYYGNNLDKRQNNNNARIGRVGAGKVVIQRK